MYSDNNIKVNKEDLRIIFFGTPAFAVASLNSIIEAGYNVVAVVTAADKPAGRGMQLQMSAVKECALIHHLPVLQPANQKSPEFLETLKSFNANLQIVIAFRMMPEVVWSMPQLGTFNLHASLLPQYRGAAPINWAIINGEEKTGVTTFFLKHEIDTGNILLQEEVIINKIDNAGTLHDKLMLAGAKLVVKTLDAITDGAVLETEQKSHIYAKHAPKIFKPDCEITWNMSASDTLNKVRGLSPYPGAFAFVKSVKMKILEAEVSDNVDLNAGEISTDGKTFLDVGCSTGALRILKLQAEGKKVMGVAEYLRGHANALK
ncbi:MAG: methionyl-tRNA formyltransferase [Bacteroidia bacterium]|nr:methionyl-tRNA formyltransferase [Bacteroidia bacterium]